MQRLGLIGIHYHITRIYVRIDKRRKNGRLAVDSILGERYDRITIVPDWVRLRVPGGLPVFARGTGR
ncbi:hypothetical protein ARZXY2_4438 (plasmid) [Arthrobacter sp. ZXY-2]|nr:hypothetical protein ARZXY2_4438 [Arthrobacter sp. ZXY-2]